MTTSRKPPRADEPDYVRARDERLAGAGPTDCAACHAPLPAGHRYLCAACVEESGRRASVILAGLEGRGTDAPAAGVGAPRALTAPDGDDAAECPTCGMRLDASGRCAVCVTTVRR